MRQTGRAERLQWAAGQLRQPLPAGEAGSEATVGCRSAAAAPSCRWGYRGLQGSCKVPVVQVGSDSTDQLQWPVVQVGRQRGYGDLQVSCKDPIVQVGRQRGYRDIQVSCMDPVASQAARLQRSTGQLQRPRSAGMRVARLQRSTVNLQGPRSAGRQAARLQRAACQLPDLFL